MANLIRSCLAQMEHALIAGVEPISEVVKWRSLTLCKAHHIAIERPELLHQLARSAQIIVIEADSAHVALPLS